MRMLLDYSRVVIATLVFSLFLATTSSAVVQYYCGTILSDALHSACKRSGFPLHFPTDSGVNFRVKRGVVEECCLNPCSKFQLRQYCNSKLKKAPSSSKRKRSHHSLNAIKRSKGSSHMGWQCDSRSSSPKVGGSSGGPRKRRRNRRRNRKARLTLNSTPATTTEMPWSPEVQYVDDWTDSGEAPLYLGSSPFKAHFGSQKAH